MGFRGILTLICLTAARHPEKFNGNGQEMELQIDRTFRNDK